MKTKLKMTSYNMKKEKVESLEQARAQIDVIDSALVELIAARKYYVDQTTRFKKSETDMQTPERQAQILERLRSQATTLGLDAQLIEQLYQTMFQHFIQRELKQFRP